MAAFGQNLRKYGNRCLQTPQDECDIHEGRADGAMKVGQLVVAGTNVEDYAPAGADSQAAVGVVIGFWDSNGVYADTAATAIADNSRIRVALFTQGFSWLGLLPNTVATTRGELLKAAASGRVTDLPTTPAVSDVLATYARAYEAVTASADDDTVLLSTAGVR